MPRVPGGLKHTFWGVLDTVSYPIVYFALTPSLIKYMGSVVFGLWMVLNTVTVVLQLFNFNLGYTAMRHIAYERATGNNRAVTDIINTLLKITLLQFLGIAIIGAILAFILSNTGWLGTYAKSFHYGSLCFLLAALLAGLKYFEQVFQSIVKSYDQFKGAAILNMAYRIGTLSGTLAIIILYPKMILYVLIGNIIFSLCYLAIHFGYIKKLLPFYSLQPVVQPGLMKGLFSYSIWPWLQSIIIVLTFQADRVWVSGFAGLKEVAAYGLVATMFNHIHMIFTAMVAWVSPRIIAMYARGEDPDAEYTFVRSLLTVVTMVSLLLFYLVSPIVFRLWVGDAMYVQLRPYIQGFTGFELAFAHTIMPVFYLNGTGKERNAAYVTILCCSLCYILMLGGLWVFHSPVALVHGMTIGTCIAIPVFNTIAQRKIVKYQNWPMGILEMVPVFAAIAFIYTSSPIAQAAEVIIGAWALWRFYLIHLTNRTVWKQALGI